LPRAGSRAAAVAMRTRDANDDRPSAGSLSVRRGRIVIVVCGTLADTMIELMCARLADLGLDYLLFDQLHYPGRFQVSWGGDRSRLRGYFASPQLKVDIDDVTGIYARYVSVRGGPIRTGMSKLERDMAEAEYQLALMQLLDLMPCVVVNRAKASTSN